METAYSEWNNQCYEKNLFETVIQDKVNGFVIPLAKLPSLLNRNSFCWSKIWQTPFKHTESHHYLKNRSITFLHPIHLIYKIEIGTKRWKEWEDTYFTTYNCFTISKATKQLSYCLLTHFPSWKLCFIL